jgi:hypothetical protein
VSNVEVGDGLLVKELVTQSLVGLGEVLDELSSLLLNKVLDLLGDLVGLSDLVTGHQWP